jgi:hypothetical protein
MHRLKAKVQQPSKLAYLRVNSSHSWRLWHVRCVKSPVGGGKGVSSSPPRSPPPRQQLQQQQQHLQPRRLEQQGASGTCQLLLLLRRRPTCSGQDCHTLPCRRNANLIFLIPFFSNDAVGLPSSMLAPPTHTCTPSCPRAICPPWPRPRPRGGRRRSKGKKEGGEERSIARRSREIRPPRGPPPLRLGRRDPPARPVRQVLLLLACVLLLLLVLLPQLISLFSCSRV